MGEQLRDIIGFRTGIFSSREGNQPLRSCFMTIADIERRMSDGTCRENPHCESGLIFRNGHGGKRIRVNIKRIDAVAT